MTDLNLINRLAELKSIIKELDSEAKEIQKQLIEEGCADKIKTELQHNECEPLLPPWDDSRVTGSEEVVVVTHNWDELRRFMWNYVGIVRKNKRLLLAKQRIKLLQREIDDYYRQYLINSDLLELRNLATVAELIINSAMKRKESRGLHYTLDYPYKDDQKFLKDTILIPPNYTQKK